MSVVSKEKSSNEKSYKEKVTTPSEKKNIKRLQYKSKQDKNHHEVWVYQTYRTGKEIIPNIGTSITIYCLFYNTHSVMS